MNLERGAKMKVYVATFHGDLERVDMHPMVNSTLEGLLKDIVEETGWGTEIREEWDDEEDFISYSSPDPEDDKVEIWEIDGENKTAQIVSGFWGWHWRAPNGNYNLQMILPGHTKTLYQLAMGS